MMTDSGMTRTVELVVLAAGVILAVATVGFAVGGPATASPYTEFSVLSPDGEALIADDYPTVGDDDGTVVVQIQNHERQRTAYTLVVTAERVSFGDGSTPTVRQRHEFVREPLLLADGETATLEVDALALGPVADAPNARLQFSLYRGDAPAELARTEPYRSLHLWVNTTDVEGA